MKKDNKKISIFKYIFEKRLFLLTSVFLLFFLFIPLSKVYAIWNPFNFIGNAAMDSASAIVALILRLALFFSEKVLQIANSLLIWATGNPWQVSFTNPASNGAINLGWTLLRDLVNMFFILGLAYIGLATSLNIAGFNTKKVFVNLLLVALLINFTPVFCGVIVDFANIIANFFLKDISFEEIVKVFSDQNDKLQANFTNLLKEPGVFAGAIMLFFYAAFASFILLLYCAIFLLRPIIIWFLVILSPLAFFAWIFPQSKKYFEQWWSTFIQWAFIAIPGAFFLYLSKYVLVKGDDFITANPNDPTGGLLTEITPFVLGLAFMVFGFILTMQTNTAGTGAIMGVASKATSKAKAGAQKLKTKGLGAAKWTAKRPATTAAIVGSGLGGLIAGKGTRGFTKEGREEKRKAIHKTAEKFHLRKRGSYEASRKKKWGVDAETQARLEGMSSPDITAAMQGLAFTDREKKERASMASILSKRGDFEFEDDKKEEKFVKEAKTLGVDLSDLKKSRPDLTPIIDSEKVKKEIKEITKSLETSGITITDDIERGIRTKAEGDLTQKQIQQMGPKAFRDNVTSGKALKNRYILSGFDDKKVGDMGSRGSIKQRKDLYQNAIDPGLFALLTDLRTLEAELRAAGDITKADEILNYDMKLQANATNVAGDSNFYDA